MSRLRRLASRIALCGIIASSLATAGCASWYSLSFLHAGSVGRVTLGLLDGSSRLDDLGTHHRCYRSAQRRYGTAALISVLTDVSAAVDRRHPNSILAIGDLSAIHGGFVSGHRSHRSGRDVDLAFFALDLQGRPAPAVPLPTFDRFGIGVQGANPVLFDTARNWALVEELLSNEAPGVQWIFVSRGLKSLLIGWALENDRPLDMIERAAIALRQPSDSAPHDDHIHVRIYCPSGDPACRDFGPTRPWLTHDTNDSPPPDRRFTTEELAALALEP